MSELIDSISEEVTGRRSAQRIIPMLDVTSIKKESTDFNLLLEHEILIKFGGKFSYEKKDSRLVVKNVQILFKDIIYKDIRSLILSMEMAVYEQDLEEMRKIIRALLIEVS